MRFELDSDGYPTKATLRTVERYHGPLLEFFRELKAGWWHGKSAVTESSARDFLGHRIVRFRLHTLGWSGNEELISAMERNIMLQMISWVESRRGGHYIYEFKRGTTIPERKRAA